MGKRIRHVGTLQHLNGARGAGVVQKQFRKRDSGDAVSRVVLAESLAEGKGSLALSVPHEHPCACQKKLSLVRPHRPVIFLAERP